MDNNLTVAMLRVAIKDLPDTAEVEVFAMRSNGIRQFPILSLMPTPSKHRLEIGIATESVTLDKRRTITLIEKWRELTPKERQQKSFLELGTLAKEFGIVVTDTMTKEAIIKALDEFHD